MEVDPRQRIITDFSLWISEHSPEKSYWKLELTDHGIYADNDITSRLLRAYSNMPGNFSSISIMARSVSDLIDTPSKTEATLDYILYLYEEDEDLCFSFMLSVYRHWVGEDKDLDEKYNLIHKLENIETDEDVGIDVTNIQTREKIFHNSQFEFLNEIRDILESADREVYIIDAWLDTNVITRYLNTPDKRVKKKILTNNPTDEFIAALETLSNDGHDVRVRNNPECHDRFLFVDNRGFVIGTSIKDGGDKPTYLVELDNIDRFKRILYPMWENSEEVF